MKGTGGNGRKALVRAALLALCAAALFLRAASVVAGAEQPGVDGLSKAETLRLGERIYRHGILPSGKPVTAVTQGDIPLDGTMFSCESCHLRAGFGSFEGLVAVPATTGKALYRPLYDVRHLTKTEKEKVPRWFKPLFQAPPRRPAYTDATLAAVLSRGIDPTGKKLDYVMPRYLLNDRDMAILIYYLKFLSSVQSPGVTPTTIRFGTVITDDVNPREREAMAATLENYVRGRNSVAQYYEARAKRGFLVEESDLAYRRLELVRWELKGPPETWPAQLEEYNRKEPVFALIGGITSGSWRPIHTFCEEHRLPCIFPVTDFPVISKTDWYTLYFSKGLYQEGEAAARFLVKADHLPADVPVVQIFRDESEGRALARGFRETWRDLGRQPPTDRTLRRGEAVTPELLGQLTGNDRNSVVLLWLGPEAVPALTAIAPRTDRPAMVFVSGSLLEQSLAKVPDEARDMIYITYPYGFPLGKALYADTAMPGGVDGRVRRIRSKMYALWLTLNDSLMMMADNFYRDNFLDVVSMLKDREQPYTDYERLSFGPGQRYAVKGCYVVQLSHDPRPRLVKKSGWVIQ